MFNYTETVVGRSFLWFVLTAEDIIGSRAFKLKSFETKKDKMEERNIRGEQGSGWIRFRSNLPHPT